MLGDEHGVHRPSIRVEHVLESRASVMMLRMKKHIEKGDDDNHDQISVTAVKMMIENTINANKILVSVKIIKMIIMN